MENLCKPAQHKASIVYQKEKLPSINQKLKYTLTIAIIIARFYKNMMPERL